MLGKKYRLHQGFRFNSLHSFSTPQLLVKIMPNNVSINRFAVVVSKKIARTAVRRNRIRRIIYEASRELLYEMKQGNDILFIVRKTVNAQAEKDFYNEIKNAFKKENLLVH